MGVDGDGGGVRVVFGAAAAGADEASAEDADRPSPIGDELQNSSSRASSDEPDTVARALKALACGVGREVSYSRAECRDLLPAWALTVHHAQGSEYRAVVLCLANAHRPLLRRELVYTAASRAKEALIVISPPSAMRVAVGGRQRPAVRSRPAAARRSRRWRRASGDGGGGGGGGRRRRERKRRTREGRILHYVCMYV